MIVRFLRLLGSVFFSCCDPDNESDHLQPNRRATQNRYYHYQYDNDNESDRLQQNARENPKRQNHYQYYDDSLRANLLAPSPAPKFHSTASSGSSARSNTSSYLPTNGVSSPTIKSSSLYHNLVTGSPAGQSFVDSSNTSKRSFQSKIESNAPRSSHPTKIGSDASDCSLLFNPTPKLVSGRMQIKPPFEQSDVKSNIPTSSFPLKPVSSSSPQRPGFVSFVQSDVKSNTSTTSFSTKTVQSSSPIRLDATSLPNNFTTKPATSSCMQRVAKSNSPKHSQASKTTPPVSPIPKAASSPINSTRQTITSPFALKKIKKITTSFVLSDAELDASIISASSKAGPGPSEDPNKVQKGGTQRYEIPNHIEEMIKNNIVPPVLKMPLSPVTYADYFAALLYAEDFYCEKWSEFLLKDVKLKLQDQSETKKSKKGSDSKMKKIYPLVVFEIKEVSERRPFLLSRDHVHLRPVGKGKDLEPFHGVLICVVKSTARIGSSVLAEFKDDFHKQHEPSKRYDVSFSFNRVCLKRAHRAVSAATNPLLRKILFPNPTSLPTQWGQVSPVNQILNHKFAPIPYLIEGPPSMVSLIKDIVLKIYESCKERRVLICAPKNYTCDELVSLIMEKVCEIDIFRANAAFRDKELVPDDIMSACLFRRECFTCPPLDELERFRIITSTFVSTFRLYNAGLKAGHFSHIFLLDASSAIEPEMMVALVDLVSEDTVVVVTGTAQDKPRWVRSDIARKHGMRESFFERLLDREPYRSDNPLFITHI